MSDNQLLKHVLLNSLRQSDKSSVNNAALEEAIDHFLKSTNPKELFKKIESTQNYHEKYFSDESSRYEERIMDIDMQIRQMLRSNTGNDLTTNDKLILEKLENEKLDLWTEKREVNLYRRQKENILLEIGNQIKKIKEIYFENRIGAGLKYIISVSDEYYMLKLKYLQSAQKKLAIKN